MVLDEDPDNEIERLLGATDDNDLRRIADHCARAPQVSGDGFAKREAPGSRAVIKLAHGSLPRVPQ